MKWNPRQQDGPSLAAVQGVNPLKINVCEVEGCESAQTTLV
jgi:hypothetical protein